MPSDRPPRPGEPESVRTTIVGGRPPGSGKPVGPIPRGIEVLIKKAAVDTEFKRLLLEKRAEAAREIGLVLDPAEALMLKAATAAQLDAIIARTTVAPSILPAFLGRAAAVMLVALGAGAVGCSNEAPPPAPSATKQQEESAKPPVAEPPDSKPGNEHAVTILGITVDQPQVHPPKNPPVTDGIRPDKPAAKGDEPAKPEASSPEYRQQVQRGLQAIRPPEKPPAPAPSQTDGTNPTTGETAKPAPSPNPNMEMAGVRADRPDAKEKTEPQPPGVAGIMPDRPQVKPEAAPDLKPEAAPDTTTPPDDRPAQPPVSGRGGSRPDKP